MALDAPAVMAVRPREGTHTAVSVRDGRVFGIAGVVGEASGEHHFTGVHVLDRAVLDRVHDGEACIIRTAYKELVAEGNVKALVHDGAWTDIGTHAEYQRVQ